MLDLVAFVEQQQFVGLAHLPHRKPTLEDLTRDRVLRLARRRDQLRVSGRAGGWRSAQSGDV